MQYPKINSVFMRDDKGKFDMWEWAKPEFSYLGHLPWIGYEKYDGTNTRLYSGGPLGRTDRAEWNDQVFADVEKVWERAYKAEVWTPDGIEVLYGETIGPKLQGNPHGVEGPHQFVLFDARLTSGRWLERWELEIVADKVGLQLAEERGEMPLEDWVVHFETGNWPQDFQEGLILRPEIPLLDMYGNRIQTKLKWKDFA